MGRDLAIDLGSVSTLVWARRSGLIADEPSLIAVGAADGRVVEVGEAARRAVEKRPGELLIERPLRTGTVTDYATTRGLFERLFARAGVRRRDRTRVLLCVPVGLTDVEERALREAARRAGAASAHLMEQPLAAGIGAGLPVTEPIGSMVVDVGGGTTEVAILSLGGLVTARTEVVGGYDMDEAVAEHLAVTHGLRIGERTASELKEAIGSADTETDDAAAAEVIGRDLDTGAVGEAVITAAEVRESIEPCIERIVAAVLRVLGDAPPELVTDVMGGGMWLVGGVAHLPGLARRMERETQVAVHTVDEPERCTIRGAGVALESTPDLRRLGAT